MWPNLTSWLSGRLGRDTVRVSAQGSDSREFERVTPGLGAVAVDIFSYRALAPRRRPLVIINSIEFPIPPSVSFCELMWQNGLQVIFIRRMGFGSSQALPEVLLTKQNISNGAAVAAEAAILNLLLVHLKRRDIVLLGLGSSNPMCYRISRQNPDIALSIYANAVFNQDILEEFRPTWLQEVLRQALRTTTGARFAELGLKFQLKRDPRGFYRQLLQKSAGDLKYASENESDLLAASVFMQNIEASTFFYDISMSLLSDPILKDGLFFGTNAVVLSGEETTETWKNQLNLEAKRLQIPVVYAPRGDVLVPYSLPETLIAVIEKNSAISRPSFIAMAGPPSSRTARNHGTDQADGSLLAGLSEPKDVSPSGVLND